jgi:hypothetical protein
MQEITTGHNSNACAKCGHVYASGVHLAMIALQPSPNAQLAEAANDNRIAWPSIPFPDSWYAAC